jgi:hypothetical protein
VQSSTHPQVAAALKRSAGLDIWAAALGAIANATSCSVRCDGKGCGDGLLPCLSFNASAGVMEGERAPCSLSARTAPQLQALLPRVGADSLVFRCQLDVQPQLCQRGMVDGGGGGGGDNRDSDWHNAAGQTVVKIITERVGDHFMDVCLMLYA